MKGLFTNDDGERAVSPVIGVILMVAITVILAAVIASFVLGLGDADEPAPNPTVDTEFSSDELVISFTGGDDFDAGVATFEADVVVEADDGDDDDTDEGTVTIGMDGDTETVTLNEFEDVEANTEDAEVDLRAAVEVDGEQVSAGDSVTVDFANEAQPDDIDYEMVEWDIQVIWDPADQDSEVIVSQSGSN